MAKHDGTEITIGGEKYVIPPLNLKALKVLTARGHLDHLSKMSSGTTMTAEQLEAVICTVTLALQRNYPNLDADWVEENIDVGDDLQQILFAVMNASGFKESKKGKNGESP